MSSPPPHSRPPVSPSSTPIHQSPRAVSYLDEKSAARETILPIVEPIHDKPLAPPTPLQIYQSALGIPPYKEPKHRFKFLKGSAKGKNANGHAATSAKPRLTAKNKGIYDQVLSCERAARWKYYLCNVTVTIAMFLQIVVGASVTAFGAGNASHVLITCFGAANTALASLLAVLKAQGLPNRIRQDWNGWVELREYIEEREREIEMRDSGRIPGMTPVPDTNVWQTVRDIEARYKAVRFTAEANRPDTYRQVPAAQLPRSSEV